MDKYKAIAEKITYSLDGYIADHNNRSFGDADLWLRHVRNRWEQFIEAHPDSYNFHEYLQHQQAKVEELEKHIVDLEQQMLRDSALATKAQIERNELQTLYTQQGINMLKLQKRLEELESLLEKIHRYGLDSYNTSTCLTIRYELEQALKGEG